MPPPHRDAHVGQAEAPRATDQDEVVDHRLELVPGADGEVVDEHRLERRIGEHPAVAFGHHPGEPLVEGMGERVHRADEAPQPQPERPA